MISEEIEDVEGGGKTCTTVIVNMYLRSINDIDDYKMEFSVQVTFREQWNDERLKFDDFGGKVFLYIPFHFPNFSLHTL